MAEWLAESFAYRAADRVPHLRPVRASVHQYVDTSVHDLNSVPLAVSPTTP